MLVVKRNAKEDIVIRLNGHEIIRIAALDTKHKLTLAITCLDALVVEREPIEKE